MKLHKILKLAVNMVIHSKLRSWLTILGIVIGVASVVAIIGLSNGMENSVTDRFSDMGADIVTVTPGYSKAVFGPGGGHGGGGDPFASASTQDPLTNKDVQALKTIPEIDYINTQISGSADVYFMGGEGSVTVTGVDQKVWTHFNTVDIAEGRDLSPSDQNVIVVGGNLASDYFDNPVGLNQIITIEGSAFRVVGILDDTSNSVYMPITAAYSVLDDKENGEYDSVVVKAKSDDVIDELKDDIEYKLMIARHVNEKDIDFTIRANKDQLEQASEMLSTMTLFLTAIAAVSLLVGIVGVVNTMFTSVLEKKKEIGIMKAIGAKNRDVMLLFLFNSGIMGFVGGAIGVILGAVVSSTLTLSMMRNSAGGSVTLDLVLIALAGSIVVGMLAGLIPAWNASKLKPVDSIRAE